VWVFVDGRALKQEGTLMGVQSATIVKEAQAVAHRMQQFLLP
jgi:hypothetical protein